MEKLLLHLLAGAHRIVQCRTIKFNRIKFEQYTFGMFLIAYAVVSREQRNRRILFVAFLLCAATRLHTIQWIEFIEDSYELHNQMRSRVRYFMNTKQTAHTFYKLPIKLLLHIFYWKSLPSIFELHFVFPPSCGFWANYYYYCRRSAALCFSAYWSNV